MQGYTVRAGFGLAVALFAWSASRTEPVPPPCTDPAERVAHGGYTRVVACDVNELRDSPLRGPARRLFGHPVDLNCSDQLTLETLAGIGPVRAQAIVEERNRRRFARVDDLTRVRGIGPKTLERLRADLVVVSDSLSVRAPGCRRIQGSLRHTARPPNRRHRA